MSDIKYSVEVEFLSKQAGLSAQLHELRNQMRHLSESKKQMNAEGKAAADAQLSKMRDVAAAHINQKRLLGEQVKGYHLLEAAKGRAARASREQDRQQERARVAAEREAARMRREQEKNEAARSGGGTSFGGLTGAIIAANAIQNALRFAASSGLAVIKSGLVDINAEMEQMSITFAGMFSSHGNAKTFQDGLEASEALLKIMRKDAQSLPGEFEDLSAIMLRMTTPSLGAGLSIRQTEKLAANAMAIGIGGGLDKDTVGREMGAMIQGQMNRRMALLRVLPNFDMDAKTFNAMPIEKRVARLRQALGMIEGTREFDAVSNMKSKFQNSWQGLWTTLKDNFKLLSGDITSELFGSIKAALGSINQWFRTHGEQIKAWSTSVGHTLAVGFDMAAKAGAKLAQHITPLMNWIQRKSDNGTLLGGVSDLVGSAAGVGTGLQLASALSGALEGAGLAMGGPIGAAVGIAVAGAIHSLVDVSSPSHEAAMGWMDTLSANGLGLGDELRKLWNNVSPLVDALGVALLNAVTNVTGAFKELLVGINWLLSRLGGGDHTFTMQPIGPDGKPLASKNTSDIFGLGLPGGDPQTAIFDPTILAMRKGFLKNLPLGLFKNGVDETLDRQIPPNKVPNTNVNIHKVEIKVESNQDPNRIAKRTADILTDMARHPKVAKLTGNPVFSR